MLRSVGFCVVGTLSLVACGKGEPLVELNDLVLQDVSNNDLAAYTNTAKTLFLVSIDGGTPIEVAPNIDKASFRGDFLLAFEGVGTLDGIANTVTVFDTGALAAQDVTPLFSSTQIVVDSVRDSDDGEHLFYETRNFLQEAVLNGQEIVTDAGALRGRFTPTNDFLVLSADLGGVGASIQAFPLDGSAAIDLTGVCGAEGCSNRFQVAPDGSGAVIAANEVGDFADLTLASFDGNVSTLASQVGDNGFSFLDDDTTLVFLRPDLINPNIGSLEALSLAGGTSTALGPIGVVDISSTAASSLVYTSAINGDLSTLHFISADGTNDLLLGTRAKDEGFTQGDSFFLFLDQAIINASAGTTIGTLRALNTATATITELGASVSKVAALDETRVLFLDEFGSLRLGDASSGDVEIVSEGVNSFNEAGGDVIFSVPTGKNAGLFILKDL